MGITFRTLKTGEKIFLVQKLVNARRISKTFHSGEEAIAFFDEKEKEAKAFNPNVKEALKVIDVKIAKEKKSWESIAFRREDDDLIKFRENSANLPDKIFFYIFNSIPAYERSLTETLRYKEILRRLRGGSK